MYRILHIPTGEFVYSMYQAGCRLYTILGCGYKNISVSWSPEYESHRDATNAIQRIIKNEAIHFWILNGKNEKIEHPAKAEFEIIEV